MLIDVIKPDPRDSVSSFDHPRQLAGKIRRYVDLKIESVFDLSNLWMVGEEGEATL
jgi:hypothetical protein